LPSPPPRQKGEKMSIACEAMVFARRVHSTQVRKYTGNPYADHLAEVAGIVATVAARRDLVSMRETMIATAWLHDCIEDQDVVPAELARRFGPDVQAGVLALSDLEVGNRAERKAASRKRLAAAPWWVQTIKVADLISNTSSIVKHDPKFAAVYLEEKRLLLDVLTNANGQLIEVARAQISATTQEPSHE
jgi:guanosine-3',5'-bis(diphosphate) 3'-pyrophosphohydrolase